MQRVRWRRLEVEVAGELSRPLVQSVNEQGTNADDCGRFYGSADRVAKQMRSQAVALLLSIHGEPPKQDDRDWIGLIAADLATKLRVCHRAGGEAVVAHHSPNARCYIRA